MDFDSVPWRSEAEDSTDNSRPTTANTDIGPRLGGFQPEDLDPHDMEAPQAGAQADAVDLAGVGSGMLVTNVSDPQLENDGTKEKFISYWVTTNVCLLSPPYYRILLLSHNIKGEPV